MSDRSPDPRPDPPTEPWVELRIHGVSGTPPEVMLESRHVRQVAGDSWGRFFRPVDGEGTERQSVPLRTLEGYHWGKYTSGSSLKGLWLILIPVLGFFFLKDGLIGVKLFDEGFFVGIGGRRQRGIFVGDGDAVIPP